MQHSQQCVELIKRFEGFSAKPYLCPAGIPTIGYGSTRYEDGKTVSLEDNEITEEKAEILVEIKIATVYSPAVNRYVRYNINQNQFDVLVSFTYNIGTDLFRKSTLLLKINNGDIISASNEFLKWVHCDGKRMSGLVKRRDAERKLFLKGIVDGF